MRVPTTIEYVQHQGEKLIASNFFFFFLGFFLWGGGGVVEAKLIALCHRNKIRVIFIFLYKSAFYPLPNISSSFPSWVSNLLFMPEKQYIYIYHERA